MGLLARLVGPVRGLRRQTRQTWTAVVSGSLFVVLAILLTVLPVPYVIWSPGSTADTLGSVDGRPMIEIAGVTTYPTTGRLDLTTVAVTRVDSQVSLPQAIVAYGFPGRDALPRQAIYRPDTSAQQVEQQGTDQMADAQTSAVVAALRAARQPVREQARVASVAPGGPAAGRLLPGDLIIAVDGVAVRAAGDVAARVRRQPVGSTVAVEVLRGGQPTTVRVISGRSPEDPRVPVLGIIVGTGYTYAPRISFEFGSRIGGPSAGLIFALAIYDKITPGALLAGRHLAGTGAISADGQVGTIGGIQAKIAAAEDDGATAFLVPAPNCADLVGVDTDLDLIKVGTLAEGIRAVQTLAEPGGADRAPRC